MCGVPDAPAPSLEMGTGLGPIGGAVPNWPANPSLALAETKNHHSMTFASLVACFGQSGSQGLIEFEFKMVMIWNKCVHGFRLMLKPIFWDHKHASV